MADKPDFHSEIIDDKEITPAYRNIDPADLLEVDIELDDDLIVPEARDGEDEYQDQLEDERTAAGEDDDDPNARFFADDDEPTRERQGAPEAEEDDPNSDFARSQRVQQRLVQERIDSEMRSMAAQMQAEVKKTEAEHGQADAVLDNVKSRIAETQREIQRAIDDDDTRSAGELNNLLQELQRTRSEVETYKGQLPSRDQIETAYSQYAETRQHEIMRDVGPTMPQAATEEARRWQAKNGWMADPKWAHVNQDLIRFNNQLIGDGWNADYASFYSKLGQMLQAKYPDLPLKDKAGNPFGKAAPRGRPTQNRQPSRPPVASARRTDNRGNTEMRKTKTGKTVVRLNAADKMLIRSLGEDPSNKEFLQHYAKSKMERLQQEAAVKRARGR